MNSLDNHLKVMNELLHLKTFYFIKLLQKHLKDYLNLIHKNLSNQMHSSMGLPTNTQMLGQKKVLCLNKTLNNFIRAMSLDR